MQFSTRTNKIDTSHQPSNTNKKTFTVSLSHFPKVKTPGLSSPLNKTNRHTSHEINPLPKKPDQLPMQADHKKRRHIAYASNFDKRTDMTIMVKGLTHAPIRNKGFALSYRRLSFWLEMSHRWSIVYWLSAVGR